MPSRAFQVGETDTRVDLVRPTLRTRLGAHRRTDRLLPRRADRLFDGTELRDGDDERGRLRSARSCSRPVTASSWAACRPAITLASARLGAQDVSKGLVVGAEDISGVTITVAPPPGR